jgi:tripeptidyl-peptidase-1
MLLYNFIFAGLAVAAPHAHVVHEERDVSRIYIHGGESRRVDPAAILPVRIALAQSNLEKGYDYLMQVSDPDSEHFGRHWSLEEIHEHFGPSAGTKEAVTAWLESVRQPS